MDDFVVMKLKNHKEYNKKILFVMVTCNELALDKSTMQMIMDDYKNYLNKNKDLSIIYDTRQLSRMSARTAWEGASMICKFNDIARQNVIASCVIMENKTIKNLFNTVTKVHPPVVPLKVVDNNQQALDFVIEKMKN